MNLSYAQPPSISSVALRSLKTDYPEEVQSTLAGAYGTETTHLQLNTGGQRSVAPDVVAPSLPEEIDLRPIGHSTNNVGGYDSRVVAEVYGGGSFSNLMPQRNSGYGQVNHYGDGEGPGFSGFQRPRSTIGSSTVATPIDPLNSMSGINFRNAYNQFMESESQFYSDDEDLDE
ncbi:hypothetical protein LXL04_019539 [Taraxacum kok-saghyz]